MGRASPMRVGQPVSGRSRAAWLVVLAPVLGACAVAPAPISPGTGAVQGPLPEPIQAYLYCYECSDGERADLAAMGQAAVPWLEAMLRGPPARFQDAARQELASSWERAARYFARRGETPPLSEADYIREGFPGFLAMVHIRSATGLAAVGGSEAQAVLQRALDDHDAGILIYRQDALVALQNALASM